ncbi:MAG TPA: hypothetical protein VF559_02460 [Caulobacteraceae bacterium]|jgi:hypothetical protein
MTGPLLWLAGAAVLVLVVWLLSRGRREEDGGDPESRAGLGAAALGLGVWAALEADDHEDDGEDGAEGDGDGDGGYGGWGDGGGADGGGGDGGGG